MEIPRPFISVPLQYSIYSLLIILLINVRQFHSLEGGNKTGNDPELERQILALDNYVYTKMITKEDNNTSPLPSDVPDLSIFTQLYDAAADRIRTDAICTACKIGIGFLMYKVRVYGMNATDIQRIAAFVCHLFKIATPEVCNGILERYGPTFVFLFKEMPDLSSHTFCGVALQSSGCTTYAAELEWTVDIPPEKPQMLKLKTQLGLRGQNTVPLDDDAYRKPSRNNTGSIKIIQMSDLHIDPLYEAGANAECENKILCCQGSQGRPLDKNLQAGEYGDHRKCDVSYSTLELTFKHISEEHSDAKFFYMTGDIVPHNVWSTTRADNTKIIQNVAELALKYFPSTTVIPVLGNHDPHPVNFFSPEGVPEDLSTTWIYNMTFDAYKQWIPTNQHELYLSYGYYAVEVNDKFKILVVNTNFCYEWNVWQIYRPGDTGDQLKWLINHLQQSEMKQQTVHIVGHVPPGHTECYHVFARNFYNIILRYHRLVKGQFYGHTHYDELKVFYDLEQQPISSSWIAPSLTPYEVNNAAYRVYYVDPNSYETMDHKTWIFDLRVSNQNLSRSLEWFSLYSGSGSYGLPDVTAKSLGIFVDKMATDYKIFQKFYQHYYKSLDTDPPVKCNTHCWKRILCGIVRSYPGEEENCNRIQKQIDGIILPG